MKLSSITIGRKITKLLDVIIPISILIVLISLMLNVNNYIMKTRVDYVKTFIKLITISLETSDAREDTISETSDQIIQYLDANEDRIVILYIYDSEFNNIIPYRDHGYDVMKEYFGDQEVNQLIMDNESGFFEAKDVEGTSNDIYFQWIYLENGVEYLIIYGINENILNPSFIQYYIITVMILLFILTTKITLVDQSIYMGILRREQTNMINSLADRLYK